MARRGERKKTVYEQRERVAQTRTMPVYRYCVEMISEEKAAKRDYLALASHEIPNAQQCKSHFLLAVAAIALCGPTKTLDFDSSTLSIN